MEAMLRAAFLVLLAVLGTANSQQGQNFYYTSTDNRQQSRFLPFQQNQFSTVQQPFANYFPQTNAGPFLPFRSTGFQLGPDSNSAAAITSPQKFQNSQQYSVSPFQLPEQTSDIVSDPRYDPLISSPSLFGGTSNDDYIETSFPDQLQPQSQLPEVPSQRFNSPAQQSSAPSQQDRQSAHQQFRTSQLSRFSPVAISEVTRTQDTPNNPNGLQTHSFNVHHTTRHSADEVPVAQTQGRWRSGPTGHADGADFGYRGRNIPSAPPSSSPAAYQPFSTSRPVLPTAETPGNTESALSPFGKFNSRFGVAKEQTFIVNNQHPNVLELPEAQPDSDSTVSHYVPHGGYVPQPEKRKEFASKTKNGGAGGANRNANIPPTTFAPPIILDNRIRTTLPTTDISNDPVPTTIRPQSWPRGNHRGRNKYGRPTTETSVERWPKNAKPKGAFGSNASPDVGTGVLKQSTSSAEDNSNFEVVTMSQDHLFVSEDNFKGFVDSASIDSTESPITDDIKDTSEGATVATIAGHGKKKFVPTVATPKVETPEPRLTSTESTTERSHRKSSTSSTTTARPSETPSTSTEGWIIVASVQTSRSVSGARFIPSAAIKQEQHPLPLDSKSIKDLKTQLSGNKSSEHGSTDSTTTARTSSPKTSTVARSTSTLSTESIIDKLDQVQSDLSSGILSAFQSQDKSLMDMPGPTAASVRTTEATSTTDSGEERFSRKFVPSSKTTPKPKADRKSLFDSIHFEDPGNLLPPGFKVHSFSPKNGGTSHRTTRISESRTATATTAATTSSTVAEKSANSKNKTKSLSLASIKSKIKFDDVSQFLPPGYTPPPQELSSTEGSAEGKYHSGTSKIPDILSKAKPVDISNFLPPDFKLDSSVAASSTETSTRVHSLLSKISFKESNDLLPADYTTEAAKSTVEAAKSTSGGTKVVFPSRPGGSKKPPTNSPKSAGGKSGGVLPHQLPHIQKGWPTRATTEFAGWPSPSPSPISIEKVLQAAKEAATRDSNADSETTTPATTTTSTTPSTTTRPSTTPGICVTDCALLGSIRLTGGVKWVPELTEHNTKEYKTLANEVLHQLEIVFQSSEVLSRWYKMISIDSFSRGSVVVDFIVEPSELGRTVNTADMRRLFHDTLIQETITSDTFIPSTSNSSDYRNLKLGKFTVDSSYTYFSVIQKTATPVRAVESDVLLPQWAIAVIVIGLASLLFVLIFGITVVISRHKNSKKHPTALTEEMLNELNKSHMGGFENYAADDLYNMEDVWNEKPFKKRSSYYQEGSMPNIYDSWRSDWNGYYGNSYYNGSIRSGYSRRRSDYDTNF